MKPRSIPRSAFLHIRCLMCDFRSSYDATSLVDAGAQQFLAASFDHTRSTDHRVQVTSTETFYVVPFENSPPTGP